MQFANESIRNNKEIVLKTVNKNGLELQYASSALKSDLEILQAAANQNILAFEFTNLTSSEIKPCVIKVINGYNFRWHYKVHNSTINASRYTVLAAVYFDINNWGKVYDLFKNDKEFMLLAIQLNSNSYHYASRNLQKDRDIILSTMEYDDYNHSVISNQYIKLIYTNFKNDIEVLNKLSVYLGLSLTILENYDQYLTAKTIMEKWFCELPPNTLKILSKCKNLYYPGAYHDFSTLQFFMENSGVSNFYFSDYCNHSLNEFSILSALTKWFNKWDYIIIDHISLSPNYFGENSWESFWHSDPNSKFGSDVSNSFCIKYTIVKDNKTWNLFYFGTEGIATYNVLSKNRIKLDVLVTQDHGLGGCWTSFCNDSLLEKIAQQFKVLPKMILSGGASWEGYQACSELFGRFGMHESKRQLFKKR